MPPLEKLYFYSIISASIIIFIIYFFSRPSLKLNKTTKYLLYIIDLIFIVISIFVYNYFYLINKSTYSISIYGLIPIAYYLTNKLIIKISKARS
ncbi:hypothetical protein SAMN02745207_04310 [Clostridium grantii DSM 8605]|uniref:Uncharacterized protein n=1 Tax=Clostridium grantii DSM 8605 TaxID=1121316 RepID=A0A1M5YAH3_9CLOT|nr:hypothetical protein SAMN02745207_04310 [Clostridium grantii DSM 8605]